MIWKQLKKQMILENVDVDVISWNVQYNKVEFSNIVKQNRIKYQNLWITD